MMFCIIWWVMLVAARAEVTNGSCKDMLQGYLTGQLSSALGAYQVEALRREFKSFTDVIEKSMNTFQAKVVADMKTVKGISGYTGGSHYTHTGATVEPLCLPRDPEWGIYTHGTDTARAYVFGAEYETNTLSGYMLSLHDHDVPCAVCLVLNRSLIRMFPGKTCYKGWTLEYQGYLMAGYHGHTAATKYTCVDSHPDTLHCGHTDKNGYLFYPVEAQCGSLKCPPYFEGRELVCAVCSKE